MFGQQLVGLRWRKLLNKHLNFTIFMCKIGTSCIFQLTFSSQMNNFEMPVEQPSMLDNMGFNGHGVCIFFLLENCSSHFWFCLFP